MTPARTTRASSLRFIHSVVEVLGWRIPAAAAVTVGIAFTEGAGLLLLVPLLDAVGVDVDAGATGRFSATVSAMFRAVGLQPSLGVVLCAFVAITAAHSALYALSLVLNPRMEQFYALALRERLYSAVVHARWSYLGERRIADVLHALTAEADRAATAVSHLLMAATGLIVSGVYVLIALRLSPVLTGMVGVCGAALLFLVRGRTLSSATAGEAYVEATRRQFQVAADSLNGLKVLKSLGAESRAIATFSAAARARVAAYFALLQGFARSKVVLDIGAAALLSLLLFVAVRSLHMQGATLLLLIVIFSRIMPRVMSLQAAAQTFAANYVSVDVILRTVEECRTHAEAPTRAPVSLTLSSAITFDGVSLTYPDGTVGLQAVDLAIPAGRTTAIVGTSGAGKSTIADVLLGLLTPTGGRILIDGQPLQESDLPAWRGAIGYVPQDGFLLPDSVRTNLCWARPDADDAMLWRALVRARADEFVRARPRALDTEVGERGTQFSGGERQRLALARALLTDPQILVLDEATSALDLAGERAVLDAVSTLAGSVTRVIITHRLSAIRTADIIYVIEAGRVVESGRWEELMRRRGAFYRLARHASAEVDLPAADARYAVGVG